MATSGPGGAQDRVQMGYGGVASGGPSGGLERTSYKKPCDTKKRRYANQIEAMQALKRNKDRGRPERGFYQCKHCQWWHLSSQDPATIGLTWIRTA